MATADHGTPRAADVRADIPVRRHGAVPPLAHREWEIEPGDARAPRTIAEYGGTAVLLAGLIAAALVGCIVYVR